MDTVAVTDMDMIAMTMMIMAGIITAIMIVTRCASGTTIAMIICRRDWRNVIGFRPGLNVNCGFAALCRRACERK